MTRGGALAGARPEEPDMLKSHTLVPDREFTHIRYELRLRVNEHQMAVQNEYLYLFAHSEQYEAQRLPLQGEEPSQELVGGDRRLEDGHGIEEGALGRATDRVGFVERGNRPQISQPLHTTDRGTEVLRPVAKIGSEAEGGFGHAG